MRIERKRSSEERRILIGMIVDGSVLGRIDSKWKGGMFKSRWANLVASWCLNYYKRYGKAPGAHIESLFETWSDKSRDKETINLVDKFLGSLSKEYEDLKAESNSNYIIDVAGKYFNKVQIQGLLEETQSDIDRGDAGKAHKRLSSYNQIEMGVGEGIDVLEDSDAIQRAFTYKDESLIEYPGTLGEFFGTSLERDSFIAFMGREKIGKSFWLLDVAYRALLQRRKVAFFDAGDMSEDQIIRRLMTRVSRHPMKSGSIRYPTEIRKGRKNEIKVRGKRKKFRRGLSWREAWKACKLIRQKRIKSKKTYLRLSCHPNSTLSVQGIADILQDWAREGWEPDVVIIDYADILNMDYAVLEGRDRINETWKQMRRLSQRYHYLVVTATQADSASYGKEIINMSNFSEDKRKLSHVTGVVGLNATPIEKDKGVMRLNWVVRREEWYSDRRCVHTAGCLAIANPAIKSCF